MTLADPTAEQLYRAVFDTKTEDKDTAALVFADRLDELGDHARAEFVRVQVELAQIDHDHAPLSEDGYDDPDGTDCAICDRLAELRSRESALLAAHRDEWLRIVCQECGGNGRKPVRNAGGHIIAGFLCPHCNGTGDATRLTERGEDRCLRCRNTIQNATPADMPSHRRCASCKTVFSRTYRYPVTFRRGLPDHIEGAPLTGAGGLFEPTTGPTPEEMLTVIRWRPTPLLLAWVWHHPVTVVIPIIASLDEAIAALPPGMVTPDMHEPSNGADVIGRAIVQWARKHLQNQQGPSHA